MHTPSASSDSPEHRHNRSFDTISARTVDEWEALELSLGLVTVRRPDLSLIEQYNLALFLAPLAGIVENHLAQNADLAKRVDAVFDEDS